MSRRLQVARSVSCPVVGYAVVFLPWLPLDEPLTFGEYRVAPIDHAAVALTADVRQTLLAIGQTFVEPGGPGRPSVMWPSNDQSCVSSEELDLDEFNLAARLLAIGMLVESEFFTPFAPPTALNFEVIAQRFDLGSEYFAIETRRRDGTTLSGGYRFDRTRFTRPVGAPVTPHLKLERELLVSLAACLTTDGPVSNRVTQSAVPFLLANRMDSSSTFQSDLFWLATAIEQLLEVSDRPRNTGVTQAFVDRVTDRLAQGHTSSSRTLIASWARELYGRRSDVHGRAHPGQVWSTGWHAFLAAHAFGLLLKQLLADENRYTLSDGDAVDIDAFPRRVAGMRSRRLESAADVWSEKATAAHWSRARRRIVEEWHAADEVNS